jgi:ankyrin repeat protein
MAGSSPAMTQSGARSDAGHDFVSLIRLIKRGDVSAIQNALTSGVTANTKDKQGWNLLMACAAQGKLAIGEVLIANGACVNAINGGASALTFALTYGHIRFMELLLRHGADPDLPGVLVDQYIPACQFTPTKEAAVRRLLAEFRVK